MDLPTYEGKATVPALIRRIAAEYGDRDFIVSAEDRITYKAAEVRSRRMAQELLARGYGKGSRIAFQLANGPSWVVTWLAISRIGGIAMPLSTLYRPAELIRILRLADVHTFVTTSQLLAGTSMSFSRRRYRSSDLHGRPCGCRRRPFFVPSSSPKTRPPHGPKASLCEAPRTRTRMSPRTSWTQSRPRSTPPTLW